MKIIWSPLALERVFEIAEYIAKDDINSSNHWVDVIFNKVKTLEKFPQSGRKVPEVKRIDIREITVGNYRIIYRIRKKQINILTVRHCRQILPEDETK